MYRLRDASTAPSFPPAEMPVTKPRRQTWVSPYTATADADADADANTNASLNEDAISAASMDTFTSMPTWPWLEPMNWNDMQIDGSEQSSNQQTSNSHPIFDPQTNANPAFLDAFPSLLAQPSAGTSDADGSARERRPLPTGLQGHERGLESDIFERSSSSTINNKNDPDVGIARLSQLSTRLYPLYRSSCILAETAESLNQSRDRNQARRSPLIEDAAFKSVAAWLVHVSANVNLLFGTGTRNPALETAATGDTLHDAFSASHHLLEILRGLRVNVGSGTLSSTPTDSTSTSTPTGGAHLDTWASITLQSAQSTSISDENTLFSEKHKGSSSSTRPPGQYSDTVVCHLVIACHTLLLSVYVAVLIALQYDADQWSSCRPAGNVDAAALADIRLVLPVQLCSYLIERQYQAVDLYLSPQSPPPSSQQHDLSSSHQPSPPGSTPANREAMNNLKMEVQQRLARLRQTLRI
ncbi:MAG: hypothetical protein Q9225_001753 [Loekoesia sp. 1 TL-2023]